MSEPPTCHGTPGTPGTPCHHFDFKPTSDLDQNRPQIRVSVTCWLQIGHVEGF